MELASLAKHVGDANFLYDCQRVVAFIRNSRSALTPHAGRLLRAVISWATVRPAKSTAAAAIDFMLTCKVAKDLLEN